MNKRVQLDNVEFHFINLDPKYPVLNKKYENAKRRWEVQLRVYEKEQMEEFRSLGLSAKPGLPTDKDVDQRPYMKLVVYRNVINSKGDETTPPTVVDANCEPLDPRKIGYGSRGSVILYISPNLGKNASTKNVAALMEVQVVHLLEITPSERKKGGTSFEKTEGSTKKVEPKPTTDSAQNRTYYEPEKDDRF
jgi:hypothetical protein